MMPITLAHVAREARVSLSTASRAFNHPEMLLEETQAQVRAAADRLGYRRNRAARALSTGTSDLVLVTVPDVANPFFPRLLRSIQKELLARGYYGVLMDSDESPATERHLLQEVSRNTLGVISISSRLDDDELRAAAHASPLLLVNRQVAGLPSVVLDAEVGIRAGLRHLAALGHRRFAYLRGPAASWSNRRREVAVTEVVSELGGDLQIFDPRDSTFDGGAEAAGAILGSGASAVQTFDDVLAQGLMHGLLARGARIPAHLSVLGCDGTLARSAGGSLATVTLGYEEAGVSAARSLLQRAQGTSQPVRELTLPGTFSPGATIGPAPRATRNKGD